MAGATKPVVAMDDTFDRLEIRVGRVLSVRLAEKAGKAIVRLEGGFRKVRGPNLCGASDAALW